MARRNEAIDKLEHYMLNPGRFAILVLGKRGTGKTHWINELFNNQKMDNKEYCKNFISISPGMVYNSTADYWESKFKEAHMGTLVVEDVDTLSKFNQDLLFVGLSTGLGAKYGFKDKKYQFRIIFTSTKDIKTLRDSEELLHHKFFDRISQLVVKFPSYIDDNSNIIVDFKACWEKMQFDQPIPKALNDHICNWLKRNSNKIHGHFRDLDKLAINCHQLLLMKLPESEIFNTLIKEFNDHFHYTEHSSEPYDHFYINPDSSWPENLSQFKQHYREWLKFKYGSLKKIPGIIDVSRRTVEGW